MTSFALSGVSKKSWLLLSLSAAWAFGCSSDEEGPKADNALRTEPGFCLEWAKRACNARVISACSSTKEGCLDRQSQYCEGLIPSGYSATNASQCLDAVERAYSNAELSAEDLDVVVGLGGGCSQLIRGPRTTGETCTDRFQCDTVHGYECVVKPGLDSGSCQVPEFVGGGARCDEAQSVCDLNFYCDADSGRCFEPAGLGDVCTSDVMCGVDAFCLTLSGDSEGTCEPKLEDRETCNRDDECVSSFCFLDLTPPQCVSNITLTIQASACNDL